MFQLRDLSMIYDMDKKEKVFALKKITLQLPDHGLVGIIGPSGSGKSTLMYCLSTLKEATSGTIIYNGKSFSELSRAERETLRRTEFGFVFQRHFLVSYMKALDNVTVAAVGSQESARQRGKLLLTEFGLPENSFEKRPAKLSGGQRQRCAIARAMINEPKVLFCDEPTASLDHATAFMVMDNLKEYAKNHLALVITHDHSILTGADRVIEMWDGEVNADRTEEQQ